MVSHHGKNISEMLEFYNITFCINDIGAPPKGVTFLDVQLLFCSKCRQLPLTKQSIHFVMPPMSWKKIMTLTDERFIGYKY